jgi:hypothetical protein
MEEKLKTGLSKKSFSEWTLLKSQTQKIEFACLTMADDW